MHTLIVYGCQVWPSASKTPALQLQVLGCCHGVDLGLIPVMPELKALSHGRRFLPFAALLDPPAA